MGLSVLSLEFIFLVEGLSDFEEDALLDAAVAELPLVDFPEAFREFFPEFGCDIRLVSSVDSCSMSSIFLSTLSILACFCANFSENHTMNLKSYL